MSGLHVQGSGLAARARGAESAPPELLAALRPRRLREHLLRHSLEPGFLCALTGPSKPLKETAHGVQPH